MDSKKKVFTVLLLYIYKGQIHTLTINKKDGHVRR
jgi:hypothetical protein